MQKIFYSYYMKFNEIVCLFFRRIHRREDHSWMVTNSSNLIDCEHESVEENPKMLAFFDSLVQRDLRYYPYMRYHILGVFLLSSPPHLKGQIISECPYEKIVCPKIATKKFPRFLP